MTSFGASDAESVLGQQNSMSLWPGRFLCWLSPVLPSQALLCKLLRWLFVLCFFLLRQALRHCLQPCLFSDWKIGTSNLISLMIASIIFKPISALLYCVVFWLSREGGDNFVSLIISVVMIGAAGFTGPALVRALVPAVAQAGGR